MKNRILPYILCLIAVLGFDSCGNESAKEENHEAEHEHHDENSEVSVTRKQFDAIKIQLGTIEQKNLINTLKVTGFLKVPPQNKAAITSMLGGTVQSILVQEGDFVSKGQTVATLVHPDFIKLQQDYIDTQSQLNYAGSEYERQKELSEKNAGALKTFQQSQSNFNSLKAKVNSLREQLKLVGIDPTALTSENISSAIAVKSPIGGNISHIDINIGSSIDPRKELMDVVDNSQLHLDLFIFEQDLPKIKVGQSVDVTLTNLPGKQYTAKVFAIGSAFEGESKSIPVYATITGDKSGLIEGMNVVANISIGNNLSSAVLLSSIVNTGGKDFIFIKHEEDSTNITFVKVEVKKGVTNNQYAEITPLSKIDENPQVVIKGTFYLLSMLTNEGEGHEH